MLQVCRCAPRVFCQELGGILGQDQQGSAGPQHALVQAHPEAFLFCKGLWCGCVSGGGFLPTIAKTPTGTQEALAYTPAGEGVSAANQKKICGAMPTAKICTRKDVAMFATTGERVEGDDATMVWIWDWILFEVSCGHAAADSPSLTLPFV